MKLYYRKLKIEDIPAIEEISKDIWEGEDYVPQVIENWLKDENCMNYGTFIDEKKKDLIGFGRVKLYNKDLAWLEGGRIKASYQRKGIGKLQLGYAIEYAEKMGVKRAQYDTGSDNFGSIALAKHFGFHQKKCMDLVMADSENIKISKTEIQQFEKLSAKEVKEIYTGLNIGPGDEICIGWSFISLKYLNDEHGTWFYNGDAILQKREFNKSHRQESPSEKEVWIIVYGNPKASINLVKNILQKELEKNQSKTFDIFCNFDIVNLLGELGFKYHKDKRFGVLLFEKVLQ
ncbi:MAG: GNAT family N-acetyltransferase [Candidatus Thorarchaeota archaeon]